MASTITKQMESFTVEDFQKHFDELMERIEDGESFIITSEYGSAIMVPCSEYEELTEEEIGCFSDHDDGC
jgi:prevent-host-death family protein